MALTWHRLTLLSLPWLLAACMTQPAAPVVHRDAGGDVGKKSAAARPLGVIAVAPAGKPAKPGPAPIPVRPLNVSTQCEFKDEAGTHGRMALQIEEASVKRFNARVTLGKRGVCNFDLAGFRQTATLPTPVLSASDTACRVYMWEQGNAVTVAFSACHSHCTADSFDYLWPILVDNPSGKCA